MPIEKIMKPLISKLKQHFISKFGKVYFNDEVV